MFCFLHWKETRKKILYSFRNDCSCNVVLVLYKRNMFTRIPSIRTVFFVLFFYLFVCFSLYFDKTHMVNISAFSNQGV